MLEQSVFSNYCMVPMSWDEMCDGSTVRPPYQQVFETLNQLSAGSLNDKDSLASELFMSQGITFTVYGANEGTERIFPYDLHHNNQAA